MNEDLRVGLAIAVCVAAFVAVAGISLAITYVFFDDQGRVRRPRRTEPWGRSR